MILNHECIRSILLFFEEHLKTRLNGLPVGIKMKNMIDNEELSEYTHEEKYYTVKKLVEADFIKVADEHVSPRVTIIKEITWKGHDYLDSVRDPKVWAEVKHRTKDLSGVALDVIKCVALEVAKNLLGL
jgi:hypothetical protein